MQNIWKTGKITRDLTILFLLLETWHQISLSQTRILYVFLICSSLATLWSGSSLCACSALWGPGSGDGLQGPLHALHVLPESSGCTPPLPPPPCLRSLESPGVCLPCLPFSHTCSSPCQALTFFSPLGAHYPEPPVSHVHSYLCW